MYTTLQALFDAGLKPCHSASGENYEARIFTDQANDTAYVWRYDHGKEVFCSFVSLYSDCGQFVYHALAQAQNYLYR